MADTYSCLDIVKGALRKLGVLASGREPRAVDRDDTFEALKGMYRQMVNNGTLGRLCDVVPTSDYTAHPNERIYRSSDTAELSITLPELVNKWEFWAGYNIFGLYPTEPEGRNLTTPRDCSVVTISDAVVGSTYDFIYDGQLKRWEGIYALEIEDRAPLAWRDPQGLMASLAVQVADEFGAQVGPSANYQARSFMTSLTSRYSTPIRQQPGVYY